MYSFSSGNKLSLKVPLSILFLILLTSSYKPNLGITEDEWKEEVKNSLVRCQWDPERDIYGKPIGRRSIQLGIRGEAVKKYVNEWIVKITDITDDVKRIKKSIDNGTFKENLLPEEKEYIIK